MSLTISGVVVSIVGTILVQAGFSESCTNEILTYAPLVIGGVMSWIGRFRMGGIDMLGRRV